jgi:hypothetical protein
MKVLSRHDLVSAFEIMGAYLAAKKTLAEIVVYGGSAILLQFAWRETSQDVDAVVASAGNHGLVRAASDHAAKELGLERSWLSEGVSVYASMNAGTSDHQLFGLYPSRGQAGLRVTTAKPDYLFAMKLNALARTTADDRDFADLVGLARELGLRSVDEAIANYSRYFAIDGLPRAARRRLGDVIDVAGAG